MPRRSPSCCVTRSQGPDHRPRILAGHGESAGVARRARSSSTSTIPLTRRQAGRRDHDYESVHRWRRSRSSPGKIPPDEWDAIGLSYTSGTTGDPKGVVYHHRGAHLNAVSNILNWGMPHHAVYLWTLPMFHATAGVFPGRWRSAPANVCLRRVEAKADVRRDPHSTASRICAARRSSTPC
jgi:fatty-acyl-CoA synthase